MRTAILALLLAVAGAAHSDMVDDIAVKHGYADRDQAYAFFLTPEATEEEKLWLARRFATCNAASWFVAETLTASPEQAKDHYAHQLGNGARFSGYFISASAGYQQGWYDGFLETRLSYWRSFFASSPNDPELVAELESDVAICGDLNALQSIIVQSVRESMYKVK